MDLFPACKKRFVTGMAGFEDLEAEEEKKEESKEEEKKEEEEEMVDADEMTKKERAK